MFLSWQKRRAQVTSKVLYKTKVKVKKKDLKKRKEAKVVRELAVSRATGGKSAQVM